MEKTVPVKDVFSQDEMVHIGVTKGHGVKGGWPRDGFVLLVLVCDEPIIPQRSEKTVLIIISSN